MPPPKGKVSEDYEAKEQTLFKSTAFGDDVDRPIKKSDGGWTYFAPDVAYHFDKIERGYDELIDVFGADHMDAYPDVISVCKNIGYDTNKIKVLIH